MPHLLCFHVVLQEDQDYTQHGHSRKLSSDGTSLLKTQEGRGVALAEPDGGQGEEQVMSRVGVLVSLETLALQRGQQKAGWNLAEVESTPDSFEASSDDELNTSIGELTVQGTKCDNGSVVGGFGGSLEEYGKGLMSTDSGVHSG